LASSSSEIAPPLAGPIAKARVAMEDRSMEDVALRKVEESMVTMVGFKEKMDYL
jgi:hypothetical protein